MGKQIELVSPAVLFTVIQDAFAGVAVILNGADCWRVVGFIVLKKPRGSKGKYLL